MIFKHKHTHDHSRQSEEVLTSLLSASTKEEAAKIRRIVIIGCVVNSFLMFLKLAGGYWGHSDALMADGYHSLNDFAADLIMLVFIGISFRPADKKFSYGYGKFETFSTFLISVFLLFVAYHITHEAIDSLKEYAGGEVLPQPDIWTVVIVIISMCAKESLFRYYRKGSEKTGVKALMTNAWHHRSDALASVATLVGVSAAHFFGEKWRILDPVASLILVIFIIIPAFRMLWPAFKELMDASCPEEITEEVKKITASTQGVKAVKEIKTRKNGHFYIFSVSVGIDPLLTIEQGNVIASAIEQNLKAHFGRNILVSIYTLPG